MSASTISLEQDDILDVFKKLDFMNRPYMIICHPSIKEQLEEKLDNVYIIKDYLYIEKNKIIIIDRAKWEEEQKKFYEGFVDYKNIGEI